MRAALLTHVACQSAGSLVPMGLLQSSLSRPHARYMARYAATAHLHLGPCCLLRLQGRGVVAQQVLWRLPERERSVSPSRLMARLPPNRTCKTRAAVPA